MTTLSDSIPPLSHSRPSLDDVARQIGARLDAWRETAARNLQSEEFGKRGVMPPHLRGCASMPPRPPISQRPVRLAVAGFVIVVAALLALAVRQAPAPTQRVGVVVPAVLEPVPPAEPTPEAAALPMGRSAPAPAPAVHTPAPPRSLPARAPRPKPASASGGHDGQILVPKGWEDDY